MAAPTVRAVGAVDSGSGTSRTPGLPTGTADGDLLVIIGEHNSGSAMSAAGSGYTEVAFVSNGGGGIGGTSLTVLAKIASSESTPTVTVESNHSTCRMIGIQAGTHGVSNVATDLVIGSDDTGSDNSIEITGITVTADSLILLCAATTRDANTTTNYSNWANTNLASITEQMDNGIVTGSGGGIGMASGTCAGTSTGQSTAATGTSENWCATHIGIPPASSGTTLTGTTVTATPTLPTGALRFNIAGVTVTATPTLPTGAITQQTTGVTVTATPTLPAGDLNVGVQLGGALVTATPTLPAGALQFSLAGTTITVTPTLPAGAVKAALSGATVTISPTLPTGALQFSLAGATVTATPTLPQGALSFAGSLTGAVVTATPTLPTGALQFSLAGSLVTITPTLPAGAITTPAAGTDFAVGFIAF